MDKLASDNGEQLACSYGEQSWFGGGNVVCSHSDS